MYSKLTLLGALLNLLLVGTPRAQEPIPFTINTLAAKTPFGFGVFTADRMTVKTYLVAFGGDSEMYVESIQKITGFTLHGAPVAVKGLDSSFSLYLKTDAITLYNPFSKDSDQSYSGGYFEMIVDVGNDDGPPLVHPVTGPFSPDFANFAGTRNDEYIAHLEDQVGNTIVSGSVSQDPDGTRHDSFSGGPFYAPRDNPEVLVSPLRSQISEFKEELTTLPSAFHVTISPRGEPSGFNITGGSGDAFIVPEPTPAALGLAGLASAALLYWSSRRRAVLSAGIPSLQLNDSAAAVVRHERKKISGKKHILLGASFSLLLASTLPAQEPFSFTINTLRAAIPFGSGAFTADNMTVDNYVSAIGGISDEGLLDTGTDELFFLQKITGFTLHGTPVNVPGLNSSFGLYWEGFAYLEGVNTGKDGDQYYSIFNLSLVVDLGNNDGTPTINSQLSRKPFFSNPAGAKTDEVVEYGFGTYSPQDLAASAETSVSHDPDGTRHDHLPLSVFSTDKGSPNFLTFPSSLKTPLFLERLTTPPSAFAQRPFDPEFPNVPGFTINGGTGRLFVVPEPTPVALAAVGLAFAATLCRFRCRPTSRHTFLNPGSQSNPAAGHAL